jgi:hypothetical protein
VSDDEEKRTAVVQGSVVVTDLLGLGKAAEKLTPAATEIVKAVATGLGTLYHPVATYLETVAKGAADRKVALNDAAAYLDLSTRSPAVLAAMRERLLGTEYRRQENIVAAQQQAVAIAQASPNKEARAVHPDFMAEWMEGVKDVSDDMVRSYWAHVLATAPATASGRVEKPVVDFLKLLDRELCQQLEFFYKASYITNGTLFDELSGANPLAQEVGLGAYAQRTRLETSDRTLRMEAQEGLFHVFELGERATRLCEIMFPEVDEEESLAHFYQSLPDIIRAIGLAESVARMTFEIRDGRQQRHLFDVQIVEGTILVPRGEQAAGVLRDMDLTSRACADELRAGMRAIADYLDYRGSERIRRATL